MSKKILRLLVVDDAPDDADALAKNLRMARFMLKTRRITDAAGLREALNTSKWDIVVSEYVLRNLNAQMAMDLVHASNENLPFIVYTKGVSDEEMINIIKAGARDVVNKARPARIIPAIERELSVAEEKKEYARALQSMKQMEEKHRAMVESTNEAVCYSHDGMHVDANKAYLDIFAYDSLEELELVPVLNLIHKDDHGKFKEIIRKANKGIVMNEPMEITAVRKDGAEVEIEAVASKVTHRDQPCTQIKIIDISKRKAAENRLQYLSQRDPLTGLYNRPYFSKILNRALDDAKNQQSHSAMLYIDLYDLIEINAELGYTAGDRALVKIAREVENMLGKDCPVARIRGVEFAALLPNQGIAMANNIALTIEEKLDGLVLHEKGKQHGCSCNTTIIMVTPDAGNAHSLLEQGSRESEAKRPHGAYQPVPQVEAKQEPETVADVPAGPGDAKTILPEPADVIEPPEEPVNPAATPKPKPAPAATPKPQTSRRKVTSELGKDIARALIENRFRLMYQPVVHLNGEGEEYFEVLLRMIGTNNRELAPEEFIPEANITGQMQAIDRWVAIEAIKALAVLHNEGRKATFFINLSPSSFNDSSLSPIIKQALNETLVPPENVVFEIDAPHLKQHHAEISQMVSDLCELECAISLDNSDADLAAALSLPRHSVRYIKISGSIISKAMAGDTSRANLISMRDMATKLDIKVIAKRIEDASSLSDIWSSGIEYVQGNYFQQATDDLNFEFGSGDETELSSEGPSW